MILEFHHLQFQVLQVATLKCNRLIKLIKDGGIGP